MIDRFAFNIQPVIAGFVITTKLGPILSPINFWFCV